MAKKTEAYDPTDNPFFDDTDDDAPAIEGLVLDFTKGGSEDRLIPAGMRVPCVVKSAKPSEREGIIQFNIRFSVEDGEYVGSGFWENIKIIEVDQAGGMKIWTNASGDNEFYKIKRLLNGISFQGSHGINPRNADEAMQQLSDLGEAIEKSMCYVTVNQWGGNMYKGAQTSKRNGITKIEPYSVSGNDDLL